MKSPILMVTSPHPQSFPACVAKKSLSSVAPFLHNSVPQVYWPSLLPGHELDGATLTYGVCVGPEVVIGPVEVIETAVFREEPVGDIVGDSVVPAGLVGLLTLEQPSNAVVVDAAKTP